jgi:hypothetical protein
MTTKQSALFLALVTISLPVQSQVFLSGGSYTEDFNNLGAGLPTGWSTYTDASSSSLGTPSTFTGTQTSWADTGGAFKNYASANNPGAAAGDLPATQGTYTDRALGIRQTGSFGDPGAAFVLQLANTAGLGNFALGLDCQLLSAQNRSTTWTVDYRIGSSGNFTPLGTYADPGAFGSTHKTFSFGNALDNQLNPVFIRVVALDASTGSLNRDSIGLDNFGLSFSPVPEAREFGIVVGLGLLGFAAIRRMKMAKSH